MIRPEELLYRPREQTLPITAGTPGFAYYGVWQPLSIIRTENLCTITGHIKQTNTVALDYYVLTTLPYGFRPSLRHVFYTHTDADVALRFIVTATGELRVYAKDAFLFAPINASFPVPPLQPPQK